MYHYFTQGICILFFFCTTGFFQPVFAERPLSIHLQNGDLADALRLIADFLKMSIIISPSVTGTIKLSLYDEPPLLAFNTILATQGLSKWKVGHVWFIAPRDELIKKRQEEFKWQEIQDETSTLETIVWPIRYARADDIFNLIQNNHTSFLSKRGQIQVDGRTNAICIQETKDRLIKIQGLIRNLDVPVKQIAITARLISIDYDFEQELGLTFSSQASEQNEHALLTQQEAGHFSFSIAKLADNHLLDIKLAALENDGHAELISNPSLFTANQQAASIEAGEEVPYHELSDNGGTAIVFKKAVLGLKVTPQVLPQNKVLLQLEINQDRPNSRSVLGMPIISTRHIKTNVMVMNKQTIVLGGIYEANAEAGQQRLPFISQMPIIGLLFKQQHIRKNKRELLIFITPTIIA